jgi:hypothetical protein
LVKADDVEAGIEEWLLKCELFLELVGVERGPNDSIRTALARALGISPEELDRRTEIEDPLHEPLMAAIEREKAAGRWPEELTMCLEESDKKKSRRHVAGGRRMQCES